MLVPIKTNKKHIVGKVRKRVWLTRTNEEFIHSSRKCEHPLNTTFMNVNELIEHTSQRFFWREKERNINWISLCFPFSNFPLEYSWNLLPLIAVTSLLFLLSIIRRPHRYHSIQYSLPTSSLTPQYPIYFVFSQQTTLLQNLKLFCVWN